MSSIRLTAAATSSLPRQILILMTAIYGLVGLFGRAPWKYEDGIGFGLMWSVSQGNWQDWLLPHLQGRADVAAAPLPYWIGGLFIKTFGWLIGATNAAGLYTASCFFISCICLWHAVYLLGRRPEVQPMAFALGGQPNPKDYGRTLADGTLMIFLACVGLAMRAHETTPALAQLLAVCLALYGLVRGLDKPIQGGISTGVAISLAILSDHVGFSLSIVLGMLLALNVCEIRPKFQWLLLTLGFSILGLLIWPSLWIASGLTADRIQTLIEHWLGWQHYQWIPSTSSLSYFAHNFLLYSWPIWPLAVWSLWFWRKGTNYPLGGIRNPHMAMPLGIFLGVIIFYGLNRSLEEQQLIIAIPPLVIWAGFSLPIIKRSVISFIDWLGLVSFTILGLFIWVMWIAMMTGTPQTLAKNIAKTLPGYVPEFNWFNLVAASVVTILWILLIRWRTSRAPRVIWRAVVISASGTILNWVLLMTLWLPTIHHAKTYQPVAERLMKAVPTSHNCIDTSYLPDAQLASFSYLTKLPLRDDPQCELLLTKLSASNDFKTPFDEKAYKLIWEDRRSSDKTEKIRLYQANVHAQ